MEGNFLVQAVGLAATVLSCSSFVPQLLKLLRSRDASGVSTRMYAISAIGFTLWTIYGFGLGATVLVASNLICLALVGTILGLRLRFRRRGGPQPAPADQAATT